MGGGHSGSEAAVSPRTLPRLLTCPCLVWIDYCLGGLSRPAFSSAVEIDRLVAFVGPPGLLHPMGFVVDDLRLYASTNCQNCAAVNLVTVEFKTSMKLWLGVLRP